MGHQKRPDFLAPTHSSTFHWQCWRWQWMSWLWVWLIWAFSCYQYTTLPFENMPKNSSFLLLPNLFNHRRREEHAFTVRANFYTVILLRKDLCMSQITRWPFSPSAALCFSVEVKGKKGKLRRVYIVDSTHQDAYLRIKHKVLFSLTYNTIFSKLQRSSYFQILTEECLISLVAWIKRAKKILTHVLQYVLKSWKQNTANLVLS